MKEKDALNAAQQKQKEQQSKNKSPPKPKKVTIKAPVKEEASPVRTQKKKEDEEGLDMTKEDAELEKILRDYNNEVRIKKNPKKYQKPFDLPYYKGVQLPQHLKWVTLTGSLYSKVNEVTLQHEIDALELEIMRLKEAKIIHKELRRVVQMPLGVMSRPCTCCRKWEKKKHWCSHEYCPKPCRKQCDEQARYPPTPSIVVEATPDAQKKEETKEAVTA